MCECSKECCCCCVSTLKFIFDLVASCSSIYLLCSDRWLVSNPNSAKQGLFRTCDVGDEYGCVTNGSCTTCQDSGRNTTCINLDLGTDEIVAIVCLILGLISRVVSIVSFLLKCCSECECPCKKCTIEKKDVLLITRPLSAFCDLIAAVVYTCTNTTPTIDIPIIGKLCARFGFSLCFTWFQVIGTVLCTIVCCCHSKKEAAAQGSNEQSIEASGRTAFGTKLVDAAAKNYLDDDVDAEAADV